METYLVGGAVRDRLLNLPGSDRDWVVVGATPDQLLDLGYRAVGREFPVFLHPDSHEEYALARTERKQGHGYHGFETHFAPDVTLEQDLERRDLTINAMAEAGDGSIIDPWGGQRDLQDRLLRHVSPAFAEDPLRVLRVARFHARLAPLGFRIAEETLALMRKLVDENEMEHLTPERVWTETERALMEARCDLYFETLQNCGALHRLLPEVSRLFGVPQRAEWHPEIDTGTHLLLCLRQAAEVNVDVETRFAVLVHDLGKGITPEDVLPSHRGHESAGVPLVKALSERLKVPKRMKELGVLVCREHLNIHRAFELRPDTVLKLLERVDALRRPDRFQRFLNACEIDACGRAGMQDQPYPQAAYLLGALDAVNAIQASALAAEGFSGAKLGTALAKKRVAALRRHKETNE